MTVLDKIEKHELRELLTKGWMTHDAMWFFHSLSEFGIEKTNKVNMAAVDSMSQIEILRLRNIMGMKNIPIDSFEKLKKVMIGAFDIIKADFMRFDMSFPEHNVIQWEWHKEVCFAYEGVKKMGVVDHYHCAILMRVEGWFKGLGISYRMEPKVEKCLMHLQGRCTGRIIFDFTE